MKQKSASRRRILSVAWLAVFQILSISATATDFNLASEPEPNPGTSLTSYDGSSPLNLGTFNIVINAGSGLSGNSAALAAFGRAADLWEARISDPITVTVDANLATLNAGIIGSTSSVDLAGNYTLVRNALVTDAADETEDGLASFLPTAGQFSAFLPTGRGLTGNVVLSKANAKALGFTGLDAPPSSGGFGVSDGSITFSNAFSFDYDNSNGVTAGTMDFETVAAHEIGHLLGFYSAVDTVDATTSTTLPNISFTTLDLFRFNNTVGNNPTTNAEFTTFPRDLRPNSDAVSDFLGSGEFRMSTGVNTGDGRQASHWKDDSLTGTNIGIMDPTLNFGLEFDPTDADFRALDVIGYEIIPEPGTGSAVLLGSLVFAWRRSRRKK